VQSALIVEALDVLEDRSASFIASSKPPVLHEFRLKGSEEALDDSVVEALAWTTHGRFDGSSAQYGEVLVARVLGATIGVV